MTTFKELCRKGGFSDATFYKWRASSAAWTYRMRAACWPQLDADLSVETITCPNAERAVLWGCPVIVTATRRSRIMRLWSSPPRSSKLPRRAGALAIGACACCAPSFQAEHKDVYTNQSTPNQNQPVSERVPLQIAKAVNEVWSMDFVSDSLSNGRRIKCLTVADDFSHECGTSRSTSVSQAVVTRAVRVDFRGSSSGGHAGVHLSRRPQRQLRERAKRALVRDAAPGPIHHRHLAPAHEVRPHEDGYHRRSPPRRRPPPPRSISPGLPQFSWYAGRGQVGKGEILRQTRIICTGRSLMPIFPLSPFGIQTRSRWSRRPSFEWSHNADASLATELQRLRLNSGFAHKPVFGQYRLASGAALTPQLEEFT